MKRLFFILIASFALLPACQNFLDEQVFTEYDPETFLQSEAGINAVITAAYRAARPNYRETWFSFAGWNTDLQIERGGGYAAPAATFANFQWTASNGFFANNWRTIYTGVRNANALLDNIDNVTTLSSERIASLKGEALFLRAFNYTILYDLFGPVPIVTTTSELNLEVARSSEAEMQAFIEKDLRDAAAGLPVTQDISGKATKGAALALLGRFLLNTKQWQKSADALKEAIDLGTYALFTPVEGLFAVENEGNDEVMFVFESNTTTLGWNYTPHAYPVGYQTGNVNYGAQFQLWRTFVNSFHPDDRRALDYDPANGKFGWILKSFVNKGGDLVDLMTDEITPGVEKKYPRSFKFTPDPNALAQNHGNDIPILRYAEVLMSRAEALNEVNGPTQASIDLLNVIRERAGVPPYSLSDFSSKEALRDQILVERGWEFFTEGLRRSDLIRHGKYISSAIERGKSLAEPHHVLFPIPQQEMDANPALVQNPGY